MSSRIAVYGIGKRAEKFIVALNNRKDNVEILCFVQSKKTTEEFCKKKVIEAREINYAEIDYLVITSNAYYEEIIQHLQRIDSAYDVHKDKIILYSAFLMKLSPKDMPYQSCKVEGNIVYIASGDDILIPQDMQETGKNWAEDSIKAFFELTKQFYTNKTTLSSGYFLDIGANIGTTSIYVKKMINNNLKIIGYEPCKKNFDLFRVNCILNQVEEIEVELLGLSNSNAFQYFEYNPSNSGGSQIIGDVVNGDNVSQINVMKLDDYLEKKEIDSSEIGYIWIDVEGHEYEVLEGAVETLETQRIPLFTEFNPIIYFSNDVLEKYCELLERSYKNFVDVNKYLEGDNRVYDICELHEFALNMNEHGKKQTDLFFF